MPRLTVDLLCRCTGHASKRRRDETQEQFVARVTHLYCSEKGVEDIVNNNGNNVIKLIFIRKIFICVAVYLYSTCTITRSAR